MPARTGNTYQTSKGVVNTKTRTYTGRGGAPAGTKKVAAPAESEIPTSTIRNNRVTTSGFHSQKAARRAGKRAVAIESLRRTRTTERARKGAQQRTEGRFKRAERAYKERTTKPPSFQGKKTAGTPTLGELKTAAQSGALKTNKRGYLTTPEVRQAAKNLKQAKQTVAKTTGIQGPLVPEQKRFVKGVAKHTKLAPRAVAAQALAEQSGGAAKGYEESGEHNYLNIGPGQHFASNKEAVRETSKLLNTSPNYSGIRASRGTGARNQIQAIAASPWGTVGSTMEGTLPLVHAKSNPKAEQRLKRAQSEAKALGLKPKGSVGPAPKQVVTRFKAIQKTAHELTKQRIPYVWGGGHGSFTTSGGLDCSGAVSYVLHKAGVLNTPLTSGSMGSVLKPGPGAVTVFYNPTHTFMRIGNEYWGTSVGDSGAGGLGPHPAPSASYLAQYSVGHVPGLGKKQALQLGISEPTSFPGMTVSGTTATINSGAGTTQTKPGFSKSPIRLSPSQKFKRAKRTLEAVRGPEGTSQTEVESPTSTLSELERKYGVKTAA